MKLKLSGNYIFEHYSKSLFEWVFETVIPICFESTLFISQGCFHGGVTNVIRLINSRTSRCIKRKNSPLDNLIDYEQLLFFSSICWSIKQTKNDIAIHRYSKKPHDGSGRERGNIPSLQFQFLHHGSFRKPKYLDLI